MHQPSRPRPNPQNCGWHWVHGGFSQWAKAAGKSQYIRTINSSEIYKSYLLINDHFIKCQRIIFTFLYQGDSPQAMSLAREIQKKLGDLQNMTNVAIANTERSGIRRPAPTVDGKVEQARTWLANPGLDDKGLGPYPVKTPLLLIANFLVINIKSA